MTIEKKKRNLALFQPIIFNTFMKPFLLLFFLLLTACIGQSSDLSGFQPLPDKFLGTWAEVADNGLPIEIKQTPTGAISTEHGDSFDPDDKSKGIHPSTTITEFKVFAIKYNTAYAIGYRSSTYDEDGTPAGNSYYSYYSFEFFEKTGANYKNEIRISNQFSAKDLTYDYNHLASGLHHRYIRNWPCLNPLRNYCNSILSSPTYSQNQSPSLD